MIQALRKESHLLKNLLQELNNELHAIRNKISCDNATELLLSKSKELLNKSQGNF